MTSDQPLLAIWIRTGKIEGKYWFVGHKDVAQIGENWQQSTWFREEKYKKIYRHTNNEYKLNSKDQLIKFTHLNSSKTVGIFIGLLKRFQAKEPDGFGILQEFFKNFSSTV